MKIAIIREGKNPPDKRTPLTPRQCRLVMATFSGLEIKVQASPHRCFSDQEYRSEGIPVEEQITDCDILLGVKEVPPDQLIPDKTYLFFSHTIKKQPHNRKLLQEVVRRNIRLIDYECLTDEQGVRLIAFGRWAGIAGALEGLNAWGRRTGILQINRAVQYNDFVSLQQDLRNISVPPIRIAITGDGRVAGGAAEIMQLLRIKKLSAEDYLAENESQQAVYTLLSPKDLYAHRSGKTFNLQEFFNEPQHFICDFSRYYRCTDLLINAIYWDPRAPRLFSLEEMSLPDFKIRTIADISCDIGGSVPATTRVTTIDQPVMGYDPQRRQETEPFKTGCIDIIAVDNLPNELPRDASESFGEQMAGIVIPELLQTESRVIERATLTKDGHLTPRYAYLEDYLRGA